MKPFNDRFCLKCSKCIRAITGIAICCIENSHMFRWLHKGRSAFSGYFSFSLFFRLFWYVSLHYAFTFILWCYAIHAIRYAGVIIQILLNMCYSHFMSLHIRSHLLHYESIALIYRVQVACISNSMLIMFIYILPFLFRFDIWYLCSVKHSTRVWRYYALIAIIGTGTRTHTNTHTIQLRSFVYYVLYCVFLPLVRTHSHTSGFLNSRISSFEPLF